MALIEITSSLGFHPKISLASSSGCSVQARSYTDDSAAVKKDNLARQQWGRVKPRSPVNNSPKTKRALCIGLSYEGKEHELPGCHKDAIRFATALRVYAGYEDTELLLNEAATVANVTASLRRHLSHASTRNCEEVCCFFSGHGYQVKERVAGSEANGKDQVIICSDGYLRDDHINQIILSCHPGCRVVCVFDCCTSGTVSDLPIMGQEGFYGDQRKPIVCVAAAEDGKTALQIGGEGILTKYLIKNVLRGSKSLKKIHRKKLKNHQHIIITGTAVGHEEKIFAPPQTE